MPLNSTFKLNIKAQASPATDHSHRDIESNFCRCQTASEHIYIMVISAPSHHVIDSEPQSKTPRCHVIITERAENYTRRPRPVARLRHSGRGHSE